MDPTLITGLVTLVVLVLAFGLTRFIGPPKQVCNRCRGTGQVNERWPDPSEAGGWHIVEGKCPKCKGTGKISVR